MLRAIACHASGSAGSLNPGRPNGKFRRIGWADVEAMADSFGTTAARGDGWVSLGLPVRSA